VHIGCVELVAFRNHRALTWSPSPKLNLVTAPNGQGKTNLLEALAFLVTGRSFRTARPADIPTWGSPRATVSGELCRSGTTWRLRRVLERADGTTSCQTAGAECPWARVVVFGWQDLEILTGGPGVRRAFVDGVAARLWPAHRAAVTRYRQVLARRNALLQQRAAAPTLEARLAPWDEQLAAAAVEVVGRRLRAVAALQPEVARIASALLGPGTTVELRYRTTLADPGAARGVVGQLGTWRAQEIRRGQSLVGPHRDELLIELDGVDARTFGSRGQQRMLALSLRLAELAPLREVTGTSPVLLLDDALSELDAESQDRVVRVLETFEQVVLTAATPPAGSGVMAWWILKSGDLVAA
jgi:DNA replication and repair protein RecF